MDFQDLGGAQPGGGMGFLDVLVQVLSDHLHGAGVTFLLPFHLAGRKGHPDHGKFVIEDLRLPEADAGADGYPR